jgi:hypothetical protein
MQTLLTRISMNITRAPMIKFLGPRAQLHTVPQTNTPPPPPVPSSPASPQAPQTPFQGTNYMRAPSIRGPVLEPWMIEAINSGGIIEPKAMATDKKQKK